MMMNLILPKFEGRLLEYNEDDEFKVDTFKHCIAAQLNYKTAYYGLLFLDGKMPEMDGFDLYFEIKENR